MAWWIAFFLKNLGLFTAAMLPWFLPGARRHRPPFVPWVVASAWIVVAVQYIPVAVSILRKIGTGDAAWTYLSSLPVVTVVLALGAGTLMWTRRVVHGVLLVLILACTWLLWHVYVVRLVVLRQPLEMWWLFVLALSSTVVLGAYAALEGLRGRHADAGQGAHRGSPHNRVEE